MFEKRGNSSIDMRIIKNIYNNNIDRFYDDVKALSKRHGVGVWDAAKRNDHSVTRGFQISNYQQERDNLTSKRLEHLTQSIKPHNRTVAKRSILAGLALGALHGATKEQPKGKARDLKEIGRSTAIGGLGGATAGALMAALISKKPDREYRKRYREPVHFFRERNHLENFVPGTDDDRI